MSIKIGINPLTWTNDDLPSLGADTPLEICLQEGKLAGYAGFELGNKFPRDPAILGPILAKHDLALVSGWYSLKLLQRTVEEEIEAATPHLNLLRSLGAKVIVVCEVTDCIHGDQSTPVYLRKRFPQNQWAQYADKISAFAQYTKSLGIQVVYHHHMGTVIQTTSEIATLMETTDDSVGLLLDTGHLTFSGEDPISVATQWIHRIHHVHCKDVRECVLKDVLNKRLSFLNAVLQGVFTVPGDGCVDYPALFNLLKTNNYQGWLVVEAEQDPAIAHPLTYAQLGFKNLSQFAKSAGLI